MKPSICGNLVPHIWYHKLLRPCGKSDTTAIAILSELLFLYRYKGDTEFRFNFKTLAKKFNFGVNQVRDAIVRLESSNLVSRCPRTIVIQGRSFANEMFLSLNVENVLNISNSDNNFSSSDSDNNNSDHTGGNNSSGWLEISSANIDKKDLKEISRSNESNFFKTSKSELEDVIPNQKSITYSNSLFNPGVNLTGNNVEPASIGSWQQSIPGKAFGKALLEYYPLSQEDVSRVQLLSGREFDVNFTNQSLLKMSKKYPERLFYTKESVLNYITKVLIFELRDTVQVSNGNFTFACNQDQEVRKQEQYLTSIEASSDTSYEGQLRKKIAGIFPRELAYGLLHGSVLVENKEQDKNESLEINLKECKKLLYQNSTLEIHTSQLVKLTPHQESLLLSQVQSVYGCGIVQVICVSKKGYRANHVNIRIATDSVKSLTSTKASNSSVDGDASIWGRVRSHLVKYFQKQGRYLDDAWFSKLTASEDRNSNQLSLKAPSNFIRDYVSREFKQVIETCCARENYQLAEVI